MLCIEIVLLARFDNMTPIERFVNRYWKPLTLFTIILLMISAGILINNIINTGSFIKRDIELIGGKLITMDLEALPNLKKIESVLPETNVRFVTGLRNTLLIEADINADENRIVAELNNIGISGEYSVRSIGPVLSEVFWKQTQLAIVTAFIFMAIVVFLLFRSPVPCSAVILAAITDITVSLAVLNFINIELSLPVLAAILMLIGYSVDTDIVLTTELTKVKEREIPQRVRTAMKTGLTMTFSALAALIAMYFVSGSQVLQEIALVLIIGLIVDIPATWLTNAGILRWWIERKEKTKGV